MESRSSRAKGAVPDSAAESSALHPPASEAAKPKEALDATGDDVASGPLSAEDGIDMEPDNYDFLHGQSGALEEDDAPNAADSGGSDTMNEPDHNDDSADMFDDSAESGDTGMIVDASSAKATR